MKQYDAECPVCGRINKGLYLEETGGFMECEACGNEVKVQKIRPTYYEEKAAVKLKRVFMQAQHC